MMFKHPGLLWLLTVIVPITAYYIWKLQKANPSMGLSTLSSFAKLPSSWKVWMMHIVFGLEMAALACIIIALARPQTYNHLRTSRIEGTDIVLALDISGSMMANDFEPNRFQAAKNITQRFINSRTDDNIALVVFAGESLSLMPLTNDRAALVNALENVKPGSLADGTALGDGLTSSVNRILSGKAKSKSIILLTDGSNNSGDVPPSTAAEIAKKKGIRVYTIGVGTNGTIEVQDPYGFSSTTIETKIDEESLRSIANATGGKYFRATDRRMLQEVFEEIDKLEKTSLDVNRYTRADEDLMPWALGAVLLYSLVIILRLTLLRKLP